MFGKKRNPIMMEYFPTSVIKMSYMFVQCLMYTNVLYQGVSFKMQMHILLIVICSLFIEMRD